MARKSKKKSAARKESAASRVVEADAQRKPWFKTSEWIFELVLFSAIVVTYSPVWWAGFVWDDDQLITANPCIVGPLGLKEIWLTSEADICPLTITTFWIEHAIWGSAPFGYHLINVLFHAASAIVLWRVLTGLRIPGAWLGAALWALHPVQVESVAWVSEMKNTESGLFFLLSTFYYLEWLKAKNLEGLTSRRWCFALTLICAALAMASKSSAVVLPAVLCLCAWWMEPRWKWSNAIKLWPVFSMAALFSGLALTTTATSVTGADVPWQRDWLERILGAGDALWFYLGKLIWPYPLMAVYPRWIIDSGQWVSYVPLGATTLIFFVLWLKREGRVRPYWFAFVYFIVALLPVLGLVDQFILRYSLVFDHFQYLASIGPLALAGAGLVQLSKFGKLGSGVLPKCLFAGLLLIMAIFSWNRAWAFQDEESLWTDTLNQNPNCWVASNNLGKVVMQKGQVDDAQVLFRKALEINPSYPEACVNLGSILDKQGKVDEAIALFRKAQSLDPGQYDASYNLGVALYFQKGQVDDAMVQFQQAIRIKSYSAEAHNNLGLALVQKGELDRAIDELREATDINPDFAEAHNNLGMSLYHKGQTDQAIAQYQLALQIAPNFIEAHNNLGNAYLHGMRAAEAIAQFQLALAINPNIAVVQFNLGNALAQQGQWDEAINRYRSALQMNPNISQIHASLGKALIEKNQFVEAVAELQSAVRLNPNDSEARSNLAKAQALAPQASSAGTVKPTR